MLSKEASNAINVYIPSPLHLFQFLMLFDPIWSFLSCYSLDTVPWLCFLTIIHLHLFWGGCMCIHVHACARTVHLWRSEDSLSVSPLKCPPPLRQDLSLTRNFGTQVRLVSPSASVDLGLCLLSWHCWDYRHLPPWVPGFTHLWLSALLTKPCPHLTFQSLRTPAAFSFSVCCCSLGSGSHWVGQAGQAALDIPMSLLLPSLSVS